MNRDELEVVANLTLSLTELRLKEVGHLCIENFATQLFEKLIKACVLEAPTTTESAELDALKNEIKETIPHLDHAYYIGNTDLFKKIVSRLKIIAGNNMDSKPHERFHSGSNS